MKKFRTKIPDLEVFLYGFCYFDAIFTKAIERRLRGCFANSLLYDKHITARKVILENQAVFLSKNP